MKTRREHTVAEKAAFWDALMGSERIWVIGSAGLHPGSEIHHIGVEFFSVHPAKTTDEDYEWFMRYVNALLEKGI